jgi:hypothetical protein
MRFCYARYCTLLEVQDYWQNKEAGDAQWIRKWSWCKGCLVHPSHLCHTDGAYNVHSQRSTEWEFWFAWKIVFSTNTKWKLWEAFLLCYRHETYCNTIRLRWGFYSWLDFITHKYLTLQLKQLTDNTLKQYLSEQPFYSRCTSPRVSQETPPTGPSQAGFTHSSRPHSQQSILLPANSGPQDHTAPPSLFLASPNPTALEVQH